MSKIWQRLREFVAAQQIWIPVLFLLVGGLVVSVVSVVWVAALVLFLLVGGLVVSVVSVALPRLQDIVPAQHRPLAVFLATVGVISVGLRFVNEGWAVFFASLSGGGIGIWLANRRASAMVDNVRLNRFKDAVGMLGNEKSSAVLVGAVYALHEIAEEDDKLRRSVFHILCEFVRKVGEEENTITLVARQTALQFLFGEDNAKVYSGRKARMAGAKFAGLNLSGMNFTGADFAGANFENAVIHSSVIFAKSRLCGIQLLSGHEMHMFDFSGADMRDTNFLYVHFEGCDFAEAKFRGASFEGCSFREAKNLTYAQLKSAKSLRHAQGLPQDLKERLQRDKPGLFGELPQ